MIAAYQDQYSVKPMTQNGYESTEIRQQDLLECVTGYAKQHPEKFALWCFGIGFVLGWRLKPW